MIPLLVGVIGALGVFYLYTAAIGWKGVGLAPFDAAKQTKQRKTLSTWMTQAGIVDVTPAEFVVAGVAAALLAGLVAFVALGAVFPAIAVSVFGATAPTAAYRNRRNRLRSEAREAWPRLIEELRVQTSSIGRSVPVALLDVGTKSPTAPMRAAFGEANREWLLTTDFARTVRVLKDRLADPSADAVCETLLVAHDLGGSDLDKRLRSLIDDRSADLEERRDAVSRQSGVRFARWFTLVVPFGMSVVGMTIGNGRESYRTSAGQIALLLAVACTALCWIWASRIMVLPEQQRVLDK
jgi:tight adherence protein B